MFRKMWILLQLHTTVLFYYDIALSETSLFASIYEGQYKCDLSRGGFTESVKLSWFY